MKPSSRYGSQPAVAGRRLEWDPDRFQLTVYDDLNGLDGMHVELDGLTGRIRSPPWWVAKAKTKDSFGR